MVASCPSLRCSCRKNLSYAEKQRVWSRSCGPKKCYNIVIVLSVVLTAANQWTIVEIEILAPVSWTCGYQPLSCRGSQNVMHCRKEMCWTCLFRESMPFFYLSLHSLPEAWASWEPRTFRHLCIKSWWHHAHPFVAAAEKTCHMQRSRGSGRGVVVSKICYNTVIVLSVVLWDCCKPTNNCRDWDFSTSELEVGLPAFQLPMFTNCDGLPKRDLLYMFV